MPPHLLKIIANGIFFSLLSYGIQIYGSVSGLDTYLEGSGRHQAMTREDSHKIQVVMHLSFHQMCAYYSICLVKKILTAKEPSSLFQSLSQSLQPLSEIPRRTGYTVHLNRNLTLSRESFLYQGPKLYSKLPESLTSIEISSTFRKKLKCWVQQNVPIYM